MAKRDLLTEIRIKKSRSSRWSQYDFYARFNSIDDLIFRLQTSAQTGDLEILRSIPVSAIGIVESHFRGFYCVIINRADQYTANALKLIKDEHRLDFDFLPAIQKKKLSLGELVSHLIRLNKLEDINATISQIMNFDFLNLLKDNKFGDVLTNHTFLAKSNPERSIESTGRLFSLRHILAHEYALNIVLDKDQILQDYENLKYFICASTELLEKRLDYFVGYTQMEMSNYFANKYEQAEEELTNTLVKVKESILAGKMDESEVIDLTAFDNAIDKWKDFRKAYADVFASIYSGGSAEELIRLPILEQQTTFFRQNLEDEYYLT